MSRPIWERSIVESLMLLKTRGYYVHALWPICVKCILRTLPLAIIWFRISSLILQRHLIQSAVRQDIIYTCYFGTLRLFVTLVQITLILYKMYKRNTNNLTNVTRYISRQNERWFKILLHRWEIMVVSCTTIFWQSFVFNFVQPDVSLIK